MVHDYKKKTQHLNLGFLELLPPKLTWQGKKRLFEDVSPIKDSDFSIAMLGFSGVYTSNPRIPMEFPASGFDWRVGGLVIYHWYDCIDG